MTKAQGKVFVLAGVMVLFAVAQWGLKVAAAQRVVRFEEETLRSMRVWGDFLGGGGIVMALLCMGAAAEVTWKAERDWLKVAVVGLVFLSVGFILMG